jgi:hypothetical protein
MRLFDVDTQQPAQESVEHSSSLGVFGNGSGDRHLRNYEELNQIRNDFAATKRLSFLRLLCLTMDLDASDPRDKIYSLLGLVDARERASIKPDYQKTAEQVYVEAMAHLLWQAGSLQPACFFALAGPNSSKVPSWVPDFSQQRRSSCYNPLGFYNERHDASGSVGTDRKFAISISENLKTIAVEGICLDHIDHVVPTTAIDMTTATFHEYTLPLREIERVAREKMACTSSNSLFPVYKNPGPLWTILAANKSATGSHGCPPEYERMHKILCGRARPPREFIASTNSALNPSYVYTGEYRTALATSLLGRSFFTTSTGFLGIGLPGIEVGDIVAILFGAQLPFVLRGNGETFRMVGACYVAGIMNGEIIAGENISSHRRKFVII